MPEFVGGPEATRGNLLQYRAARWFNIAPVLACQECCAAARRSVA